MLKNPKVSSLSHCSALSEWLGDLFCDELLPFSSRVLEEILSVRVRTREVRSPVCLFISLNLRSISTLSCSLSCSLKLLTLFSISEVPVSNSGKLISLELSS